MCAVLLPHLATFSHELRHDVLLLYGLQLTYSDLIRTMIAVYPRYHNGAKYDAPGGMVLHSQFPPEDADAYRRMNAEEIEAAKMALTTGSYQLAMNRLMLNKVTVAPPAASS